MDKRAATDPLASLQAGGARRMQMRYGFNEIDGWAAFAMGDHREEIHRRLRLMGTQIIRIFVFDKPVPDPFMEWHHFAAVVQAVLDVGAKPMITFAKFPPPVDHPTQIRTFADRCCEVVWGCLEQWGGEEVKDWSWCVWNEPNNPDVGGNLSYAQYLRIYETVAPAVLELIEPHLGGRKAMIGGPAIDGTQRAYWMDWIAQLIADVDDRLLGFVNWHMYADWRPAVSSDTIRVKLWDGPDSPNGAVFESLLMAQTPQYEARARGVARLIAGRDIRNFCGEVNAVAHHENAFTQGLNQNAFGAAYYASALINLIRGGAELEMRWTATSKRWEEVDDAYGLISIKGEPTPAALAKQLFAQHVQFGDWVRFFPAPFETPQIDAILAWNGEGRRSGVFVNTSPRRHDLVAADWDEALEGSTTVLRIDAGTGGRIAQEPFTGAVAIDGYGVAVVSNHAAATEIDGP
jgi:Glycosyl hydrolases family 39